MTGSIVRRLLRIERPGRRRLYKMFCLGCEKAGVSPNSIHRGPELERGRPKPPPRAKLPADRSAGGVANGRWIRLRERESRASERSWGKRWSQSSLGGAASDCWWSHTRYAPRARPRVAALFVETGSIGGRCSSTLVGRARPRFPHAPPPRPSQEVSFQLHKSTSIIILVPFHPQDGCSAGPTALYNTCAGAD